MIKDNKDKPDFFSNLFSFSGDENILTDEAIVSEKCLLMVNNE